MEKKSKWVSCAKDVNYAVSLERHVLPEGSDTTLCGSTGMGEGAWRGSKVKRPCKRCVEALLEMSE